MNSFDPVAINWVSGTPGVVTFAGRHGTPTRAFANERTNASRPALPNADRPGKKQSRSSAARLGLRESRTAAFRVPATVSLPALLNEQSDGQFRWLIRDLLTVARRLETCISAMVRWTEGG